MESILELSRGGEAYQWLCLTLLKCVVGCNKFGRRYYKESLSEVATESDEGFVILTLENNYQRWMDEYNLTDEEKKGKVTITDALYTNSGSSKLGGRGSSRRFHGWSREGYLRFNELHGMVKEDRKRRANFELELKKKFEKEYKTKGREQESEEDEIIPANDWSTVIQPTNQGDSDSDSDDGEEEPGSDEEEEEDEESDNE